MKLLFVLFISDLLYLASGHAMAVDGRDMNFGTYYQHSCAFFSANNYGDDWCNTGNTGTKPATVLLMGDSYSNSLTTFFDALLESKKANFVYQQFGRGQCPSLKEYGPEYCRKFASEEIKYVMQHPEIKTIFIAAEWEVYFLGKDFSWVGYKATKEQFMKGFIETIGAYKGLGKKVVVILSPPVPTFDTASCLSRNISIGVKKSCSASRSDINDAQTYRQFMIPFLAKENIKMFDPVKYFCSKDECIFGNSEKVYFAGGCTSQAMGVFDF